MTRAFTTREKVLLVVLALMIIAIAYFKFILEPINDSVAQYQTDADIEQDEITQDTVTLTRMRAMQKELDELKASGNNKPLPAYDNADALLVELNTTLSRARSYSLNFGSTYTLESNTYIVCRPLTLVFKADDYSTARSILDTLHESDNINQISDLSINFNNSDSSVDVTLSISYYELVG